MKAARWLLSALVVLAVLLAVLFHLSPSLEGWQQADTQNAPEEGDVTIVFLGTSTILISDGSTHLLTDGYFSRLSIPRLFMPMSPDEDRIKQALATAGIDKIDAIPVLHSHFDHVMDSGIVAQLTGAQVLGSASTAMAAAGSGIGEERITTVQTHHPYQFGDFTLTFVPASHVPLPGVIENWTGKGEITEPVTPPAWIGAWEEGQSYGLVVEHPKARILVQGSAGMQPGELERYQADYALVATASLGKQSKAYQDAYFNETVAAVGAHTIIPVHWDNFFTELAEDVPPLPWIMDNLDASFQALAGRHQGEFRVLKPFRTLVLTPPPAPAEDSAPSS
ncbi:MAG: MBL fold metallo-hydrolase [Alcanivorax sediminis]|uniref:MBL fold metallo-hydrolase n=1 Tax=Alcanivorax sediminis TaxID=2663008 RepID=A0A6N7LU59_9GAMM|nr:MBL fold metallo-hydrolase [Alcanivorax sediminis]MQX52906.1 MBL fold metallo-hydrolase [Alcanivorax sediminis]